MTKVPGQRRNRGDSAKNFDLEERTARFGESIIRFVTQLRRDAVTDPLIRQLVRSSTSIGANYCEADDAGSRKEFRHRVSLCKRESRETKYRLRMLATALESIPQRVAEARTLWQEAKELHLIFSAIFRNTPNDPKSPGKQTES